MRLKAIHPLTGEQRALNMTFVISILLSRALFSTVVSWPFCITKPFILDNPTNCLIFHREFMTTLDLQYHWTVEELLIQICTMI